MKEISRAAIMNRPHHQYQLYGQTAVSNFPFTSHLLPSDAPPGLTISLTDQPPPGDWLVEPPLYHNPGRPSDGRHALTLYHTHNADLLRADNLADFYLWPDKIVCHLQQPAYDHWVEIRLLGTIMAFWLERQSIPALHAAGVIVGDQAVGFLAANHGGKSSLAASFVQAGYPLLTDDILPLERRADTFWGRPGYPQMRLWPEQARRFLGHDEGLANVHPTYPKRRVPVGVGDFGSFCGAARPLSCLYIPDRRSAGTPIRLEPVTPVEATVRLFAYSFTQRLVQAAGLQPQRLEFFAQLAQQIPIRRLIYPGGYDHLPRVREAILDDLA
jgi:hypothetical protein